MSFESEQFPNEPGSDRMPAESESAATAAPLEDVAKSYLETLAGLRLYLGKNVRRAIALGDKAMFLAAGLPTEEEYGAKEGDGGVGLSMEVSLDPRNMSLTYNLTHYRDAVGEGGESASTTSRYSDSFTEADLVEYNDEVAKEWFDLLYAATIRGAFKRREARYRLPDDHPSKFASWARQGDESTQAALSAWLEAHPNQEPDAGNQEQQ